MQRARTVSLYLPPGTDEVLTSSMTWQSFICSLTPHEIYIRTDVTRTRSSCDVAVTFDVSHQGLVRFKRECAGAHTRVLVLMEPRCTSPEAFDLASKGYFNQIWAASPNWAVRLGAREFLWPQDVNPSRVPISVRPEYEADAVLIAALKISGSGDSLYSLRRRFVSEADDSGLRILVAGPGWDSSLIQRSRQVLSAVLKEASVGAMPSLPELTDKIGYRPANYIGVVEEKVSIYEVAPWAVVMENSSDYVSEKLFDAICAGAAPLYIGPSLDCFGIPNEVALQVPHSPDAMVEAIKEADATQIESIVNSGAKWMASEDAKRWDSVRVMRNLAQEISAYISRRSMS